MTLLFSHLVCHDVLPVLKMMCKNNELYHRIVLSSDIKDGIVKNGIIYGPNGSGKTNFSLALFDIVNHLSQKWKKLDYYRNFVYAGNQNLVVEFEYTFIFNGKIVEYFYGKDYNAVLKYEQMSVDGRMIFRKDDGKAVL